MSKTILTGVKPTHQAHLGNYVGAIRPALEMAKVGDTQSLFFIADYHALTAVHDAASMREWTYDLAATWLACGLDPQKTIIYRQSDIPEIFELSWILSCVTPKGFMNRAHAYKAKVAENEEAGRADVDHGVNVGLYTYPVLMSADILMFGTDLVPVGEDQIQHIEFARDIAQKFNNAFGETLKVPGFVLKKGAQLLPGLDGRKMSKSYGNHIPLFLPEKSLRKHIMKIKTDSLPPEAPKDPKDSLVMDIFRAIATDEQVAELEARYLKGIGWGDAKQTLFEVLNHHLEEPRKKYEDYMANRGAIDEILKDGALRARAIASEILAKVKRAVGTLN